MEQKLKARILESTQKLAKDGSMIAKVEITGTGIDPSKLPHMIEALPYLIEACQNFVTKCQQGRAKSVKTYGECLKAITIAKQGHS